MLNFPLTGADVSCIVPSPSRSRTGRAPSRGPVRRVLPAATGALLVWVGTVVPAGGVAAAPGGGRLRAPGPDATATAGHLSLDALNEELNGARYRLDEARRRAAAAEARAGAARRALAVVQTRLRQRAALIYRRVGTPPVLSDWGVGAPVGVHELARRRAYARAAVVPDEQLIEALRDARHRATVEGRAAREAVTELDRQVTELAAARARLLAAVAAASGATEPRPEEGAGPVGRPRAPWGGTPGTPAPEPAPPASPPPTTPPSTRPGGPPTTPPPGPPTTPPSGPPTTAPPPGAPPTTRPVSPPTTRPPAPAPAPHPGAAAAVAFARAQLGKPYRFGAAGPDAYDCSGLTMAAWAAAGVRMPHYSGAQARLFPKVTWDQLRPGDIVVFYPDYHHVGIYIGGGQMIHAPHAGAVVSIATAWRETFQFGVRPR